MPARAKFSTCDRRPPEAHRDAAMRGSHRKSPVGHHVKAQHIDDQIVVAEVTAAFTDQQAVVAALAELRHHIGHLLGAEKLRFFDIDCRRGTRHGLNQVGLPGQKSRQLQNIADLSRRPGLFGTVNIRQYRYPIGDFTSARISRPDLRPGPRKEWIDDRLALSNDALNTKGMSSC